MKFKAVGLSIERSSPRVGSFLRRSYQLSRGLTQLLLGDHPRYSRTSLNVLEAMPSFQPYSAGGYRDRARVLLDSVNNTLPALRDLVHDLYQDLPDPIDPLNFALLVGSTQDEPSKLASLFDSYGSDKGSVNEYHVVYAAILGDPCLVRGIVEIGLGTNNTDVVSNMGSSGKPGASLRAFRDYCPEAFIFGADIDTRVLFTEERIRTFFVDQTDAATFEGLSRSLTGKIDLVIDDGLHSPDANLRTLRFGLAAVRPGGWVAIEDIGRDVTPLWQIVAAMLPPDGFRSYLVRAKKANLFLAQRIR